MFEDEDEDEDSEVWELDLEYLDWDNLVGLYLNAFDLGNGIIRDIAKFYENTYYFDPSKHIQTNLDVLLDGIHLTVRGNDLLGNYMSEFISNEIINGPK